MKIKGAEVKNFASYEDMVFGFEDQGLTLVSGPTGSGKSTLCDVAPWILFGKTAKDGSVDEILSWPGELITFGQIHLDNCLVTRTRGPKAKDNDLFFIPLGGIPTRGKDIPDTQRLLNEFLGMNYELYLSGAYFHEFSRTAQFFIANAKDRRLICEQIVDLSLAKKLKDKIAMVDKELANKMTDIDNLLFTKQKEIDWRKRTQQAEFSRASLWENQQAAKRIAFGIKRDNFENDKNQALKTYLAAEGVWLTGTDDYTCDECGTFITRNQKRTKEHSPFRQKIELVLARENNAQRAIDELDKETNPYAKDARNFDKEIEVLQDEIIIQAEVLEQYKLETDDLALMRQVTDDYRSIAIENTIKEIETKTNEMFLNHFDSELKVTFDVAAADKLEVSILKDGNPCSFTQLSKGQRCLLKLCFGISVMQAIQNHHGIKFEQIFIDEGLSGLDDSLKVKAYGLLEGLALDYNSVFVVEHSSEMKERFLNKISVELVNGNSEISY